MLLLQLLVAHLAPAGSRKLSAHLLPSCPAPSTRYSTTRPNRSSASPQERLPLHPNPQKLLHPCRKPQRRYGGYIPPNSQESMAFLAIERAPEARYVDRLGRINVSGASGSAAGTILPRFTPQPFLARSLQHAPRGKRTVQAPRPGSRTPQNHPSGAPKPPPEAPRGHSRCQNTHFDAPQRPASRAQARKGRTPKTR